MASGVAQQTISNWEEYELQLNKRLGLDNQIMRLISNKARRDPKRLVFSDAENVKILKAASIIYDDGIAYPILLGNENRIKNIAEKNNIDISDLPIIDVRSDAMEEKREFFWIDFISKKTKKGH